MMISFDKAKQIAETAGLEKAAEFRAKGLEVGGFDFVRDTDFYWTFGAPIPQLQAEGWSPGAIMISVDKQDGHIWTKEDFSALRENARVFA